MFNPLKSARQLLTHLPDDEEPDVHWERSRTARAKAWLGERASLAVAFLAILLTFALWVIPVLPSAHNNPFVPLVGLWVASVVVVRYKTAQGLLAELARSVDLHIEYTGSSVRVEAGEDRGDIDEKTRGFTPYKALRVTPSGVKASAVTFRDRYARNSVSSLKDKFHRAGEAGTGAVVDGKHRAHTFVADEIDGDVTLLNRVIVSHTGPVEGRTGTPYRSAAVESMTSTPPVLDDRTNANVRLAMRQQVRATNEAEALNTQLREFIDELEEYVDPSGQVIFSQVTDLMQQMGYISDQRRRRDRADVGDRSDQPSGSQRALDKIDADVEEAMRRD